MCRKNIEQVPIDPEKPQNGIFPGLFVEVEDRTFFTVYQTSTGTALLALFSKVVPPSRGATTEVIVDLEDVKLAIEDMKLVDKPVSKIVEIVNLDDVIRAAVSFRDSNPLHTHFDRSTYNDEGCVSKGVIINALGRVASNADVVEEIIFKGRALNENKQ